MIKREFFYLPEEGSLPINGNTVYKVGSDRTMLPFYGNTVIFDLDTETKRKLKHLQDILYADCGSFLGEPLAEHSFHMTLHDLFSGSDRESVVADVRRTEAHAQTLVEQIRRDLRTAIPMKPVKAVNMVSSSVVLLLEPKYAIHKQLLDVCYQMLQPVCSLSYGLMPHITLGYYRPTGQEPEAAGELSEEQLDCLHSALETMQEQLDFTVTLDPEKLWYCEFTDMNTYGRQLL